MTGRSFAVAVGSLAVLACALAGVLALEYGGGSGVDELPALRPVSSPGRPAAPAARGRPGAAEEAAMALARPLFDPSRRPPPGDAEAVAGPDTLPRLTGVLVSDAGRVALFAGPEGGRAVTVAAGGSVGRFTVRAVEPGQVVVDGPTGSRTLRPTLEGTRVSSNEPVPPPPPPGLPRPTIEDLLKNGATPSPPTPGLPDILGAPGRVPAPGTASQSPLQDLLRKPLTGIGVPGFPLQAPGLPQ